MSEKPLPACIMSELFDNLSKDQIAALAMHETSIMQIEGFALCPKMATIRENAAAHIRSLDEERSIQVIRWLLQEPK